MTASGHLPGQWGEPRAPLTDRCGACAACQEVASNRVFAERAALNGQVVEILGGEKPCTRLREEVRRREALLR